MINRAIVRDNEWWGEDYCLTIPECRLLNILKLRPHKSDIFKATERIYWICRVK